MVSIATAPRRGLLSVPAVAGIGYALSWAAGLSVPVPAAGFGASGSEIVRDYAGHGGALTVQFLLTEGLPAAGLALVPLALGRAARWSRAGRIAAGAGLVAAAISLAQFAIGLGLVATSSPGTAHGLLEALNRADGVKMLVLAAVGVAGALSGTLPRWLRYAGFALAVAIAGSGIGYALLLTGVATLAYVSLPLLILFVAGSGIALGRTGR
ncbi:hypothetical protein [Actinomadura napierensis]|uniref:hypothetical protein n=1 Tax=Actinomadura napierensis TaxID=267854 RepID=UPI0031E0EAC3